MSKPIEIGLFCGTFNPIHNAHLLLAQCASDQFHLQQIYFVTSPRPPHRQDALLPPETRHTMVSLAVSDNDNFIASAAELDRPGLSYTVDTIKYFKEHVENYGGNKANINLLLGADNILHLPTWHKFDQIIKLAKLLIAPRRERQTTHSKTLTEAELAVLGQTNYAIIDFPLTDISSSNIRQRIKEGQSIHYMVPEPVWQFIIKENIYKQNI